MEKRMNVYSPIASQVSDCFGQVSAEESKKPYPFGRARAALIIAHPSHELLVHGWLQRTRPCVFVLTDGSGRSGRPRLDSTTKVLDKAGAAQGSIYGRLTDRQVYDAILACDVDLFLALAESLAEALVRERIEYVAGDAYEGYNTAHDIWRLVIGVAVEMASRSGGQKIANFDFALLGRPGDCPESVRAGSIWIHLDEDGFARKVEAVRGYNPDRAPEVDALLRSGLFRSKYLFSDPSLAEAIGSAFTGIEPGELPASPGIAAQALGVSTGIGIDAFRVECLRPVTNRAGTDVQWKRPPFYELYGEKLVAAGRYDRVIRYRDHLVPLANALWHSLERGEC
jgi:hypothetical protein